MRRRIVVGVDGSRAALTAVRWAAESAARRRTPLRLVHAAASPLVVYPGFVALPSEVYDDAQQRAYDWLQEAVAVARQVDPDLRVETDLPVAAPGPQLIAESKHARMIVLGSRGRGMFAGMLLGSTAAKVAAHARCAVAVVREPPTEGQSLAGAPVVVGIDGSPVSEAAIEVGFDEAAFREADLIAVHAVSDVSALGRTGTAPAVDTELDEARRVLAERLAGWREKYPEVAVQRTVVTDRPLRALLVVAAGAQQIVVGSRGLGGLSGQLLGSVSQALLYQAPCTVIVVRREAAASVDRE